jgi:hypothetical protein
MLKNMLHLTPAHADERPQAPRTQGDKLALNIRAAQQFHAREEHLQTVPRKAAIQLTEPNGTQTTVKPSLSIDNCRRRADKLIPKRPAELDALGMRW